MAGDWIKIEHTLPDKPEVFRIAMELGITPEHVAGCLLRVWIWADQQSINGNALTVTGVTLDRIACNVGFAKALKNVGWLNGDDFNFTLPNFERHNGETAKTRALTSKRVKTHRALQCNDETVTREEKRRVIIYTPEFDKFWNAYPNCKRKGGRPPAYKTWQKLKLDANVDLILSHIAFDLASREDQFIPAPSSYLNKQPWDGWTATSENQFEGVR